MNKIVFATNNENKVAEIKRIVAGKFTIVSLRDAGIEIDIPEPYNTLEENASTKSQTVYRLTGEDCFSEDTGLEVEALNGEPGVKSARYASETNSPAANIDKLLQNLSGIKNRKARFRTVISLLLQGTEYQFEGICEGTITETPKGTAGFGYDSVFIPQGSNETFAEMPIDAKNKFSHRKKATEKLATFLSEFGKNSCNCRSL